MSASALILALCLRWSGERGRTTYKPIEHFRELCTRLLEILQERHDTGPYLLVVAGSLCVCVGGPQQTGLSSDTYLLISSHVCFASDAHLIPSRVCSSSQAVASFKKSCKSARRRRWYVCSAVRGIKNASCGSRGSRAVWGEPTLPAPPCGGVLDGDAVFSASLANGELAARRLGVAGGRLGMLGGNSPDFAQALHFHVRPSW